MAEPAEKHELSALALMQAFAGNASATAHELGVPRKVVIKAVQHVAAERDWLLSLWGAGVISRLQCERLAVLLDLLPPDLGLTPQAADVRKVAQTLPAQLPPGSGVVGAPSDCIRLGELNLNLGVATTAGAVDALDAQDALLLADIEARLTDEVRGLIASLHQFGCRAELIGKEIPDGAKFCKSVTLLLTLLSFQLAYSFGKDLDTPIFFDDGAEYLRKLNLSLSDFVRELTLDGRRFLAIALIDQQLGQLGSAADRGDKC